VEQVVGYCNIFVRRWYYFVNTICSSIAVIS